MKSVISRIVALSGVIAMTTSAPALAAAQAQGPAYSPWAALSAFASQSSSTALCGSSVAGAAAATAQAGAAPGCVLPQVDAPLPAPVETAAPVALPPAAAVAAGGGIGVLPLLVGLAALAGIAALLLRGGNGNNDDGIVLRPISPA